MYTCMMFCYLTVAYEDVGRCLTGVGITLTHFLHLEIWMSKPQLRAREINRSISSKRRDTTIFEKIDSKAVCAASLQSGGDGS